MRGEENGESHRSPIEMALPEQKGAPVEPAHVPDELASEWGTWQCTSRRAFCYSSPRPLPDWISHNLPRVHLPGGSAAPELAFPNLRVPDLDSETAPGRFNETRPHSAILTCLLCDLVSASQAKDAAKPLESGRGAGTDVTFGQMQLSRDLLVGQSIDVDQPQDRAFGRLELIEGCQDSARPTRTPATTRSRRAGRSRHETTRWLRSSSIDRTGLRRRRVPLST